MRSVALFAALCSIVVCETQCSGNFSSNETGREFKGPYFKDISVDSNNETSQFFPTVRDQEPLFKWERKQWESVLKNSTQTCLNSSKPSSVAVKFKYPIFAKREIYEKKFVHGFYAPMSYLVMKKGDHDLLTIIGESVEHLWVTLGIWVAWTLISGVIIWLLDRQKNPLQFPSSFWQGFGEGTWWAVVTMTTVGYGDRSPRYFLARMYAAVWMIVGMVILSTFTADVSSLLTAREVIPRNTYLSKTIGVPVGSKNLFWKEFRGATIKEMASLKDLENHLQTGNGLHGIVSYTCVASDDVNDKQIVQVLNPHIVGIKMSVIKKKISETMKDNVVKCVREMIEEHHGISPLTDDDDEFEHHKKQNCNIEMRERSKFKDFHLTARIILYASLGLLAAILIAGSVWDMTRSREQETKVEGDVETRASFRENDAEEPIEIRVTMGGEHERKN